jgi:hypothetical protein
MVKEKREMMTLYWLNPERKAKKMYAVNYDYMGINGRRLAGIYYTYYLSDVFAFASFVRRMLGEVSCDISRQGSEE